MSRRTIAHSQRKLETHTNSKDGVGTWTTAVYVRPSLEGPEVRMVYGLYAQDGEAVKHIMDLSCRFGRAIRRAHREGRYYPGAFMSHGEKGFPRYYVQQGVTNHLRGQDEARREVTAQRTTNWGGESLNDVMVDIIRSRLARGL